ncbi:FadR/GntR family transcriptional regulator [Paenibacillus sp. YN15]|uniref:FadR/GntR family transcriptional regulator n=1 Tax=Paenibacillus sp. YN15 TaxID=1742774 RepID=UPI000DCAFBE1|nr:FadR/GntR family transcriptional regulator [Paenibacillus sp. YN15]RAU97137.1 GntR family transcriptional regulator [Paenibacillus sp. YN15]
MPYSRVQRRKSCELVAEQIEESIKNGLVKPGERLDSVEQLGKRFQVGRSTIREALSALRATGLVEIRQGEGTFVAKAESLEGPGPLRLVAGLTRQEVLEFFEVRKIVEAGAASAAAAKRTPEHLAAMKEALQAMQSAVRDDHLGEEADAQFHLAVADATGNRMLAGLMLQISDTLQATMKESRRLWLFSEDRTLERLHKEHSAIFDAIEEGNAPLAGQLMLAHLSKVEQLLLRHWPDETTD